MNVVFLALLVIIFGQLSNLLKELKELNKTTLEARDATRAAVYGLSKLVKERQDDKERNETLYS